jgi:flagellin
MTVISTNVAALRAANASTSAQSMLNSAMQRLSTGQRINSAADDAAGLAIATSMQAQISGMNQGIRNANDGIAMAQTANGALDEVTNNLQRMRELTVQAANGTYSSDELSDIGTEMTALSTQITNVLTNTQFNGKNLFDGTAGTSGTVTIQAGANAADKVTMDLGGDLLTATAITNATGATTMTNQTTDNSNLAKFDTALTKIASVQASLGATQNQLQSAVNNLTSDSTNLTAAKSQITDADFSAETTNLAKAQILSQASTAMLAQANQSQQGVLKLLQ